MTFFDRVTFPSTWKNAVFAPKNRIIISSFALPSSARVPFTSRHFLSLHEKSAHPLFWKQKFFVFCCRFSQLRKQGAREMRNDCLVLIREIRLMKKLRNCGSTKANSIRSHILLFMSSSIEWLNRMEFSEENTKKLPKPLAEVVYYYSVNI